MNRSAVARPLAAAIVTITLAAAGLVAATPAQAATRTISGTVSLPAGFGSDALDAVTVYVYPAGSTSYAKSAQVSDTGVFSATGLAEGAYNVCAFPGTYYQPHGFYPPKNVIATCYNTADVYGTRGVVDATAGDVTGLHLALPLGRTISGKVTFPEGTPASWLGGVEVSAYFLASGGYVGNRATVNPSTGAFTVDGLHPGQYPVQFRATSYTDPATGSDVKPQFTSVYWGTGTSGDPSTIDVRSGNVTGIDITLTPLENPTEFTVVPRAEISGSPIVGATLTAVAGTWKPAATTLTYQWRRDSSDISGATNATYTVTPADLGAAITVRVTGSAPGISQRSSYSDWLSIQSTFTSTGPVTVSGTGAVGSTLTCNPGTWTPTPTELGYYWYRGNANLTEGSSRTYTITASDAGTLIHCRVQGGLGSEYVSVKSPGVSVLQTFTTPGTISISGTLAIGEALTATTTGTSPASDEVAYTWYRNGTAIAGATDGTYVLTTADSGATLKVTGEVRRVGYVNAMATPAQKTIPTFFSAAPVPTITGTVAKGATLTAATGTWSPTPTLSFQWLRDGNAIAGATSAAYVVSAADGGHTLAVRVTGTRSGVATQSRTSLPTSVPSFFTATPTPTINGTFTQGSYLTVNVGTWSPTPSPRTIQWLRDGVPIPDATASGYTLTAADATRTISVRVTAALAGFATESRTSAGGVVTGVFTSAPVPTITGTPERGGTLTANPGTWTPAASLAYQWLRGGVAIDGATAQTYVVTAADGGASLSVRVTGTRTGYDGQTRISGWLNVPYFFTATPSPTLTGTAEVGSTLTVTAGSWTPTPTTLAVQWLRNGSPIDGAVNSTYVLSPADGGQNVSVRVTAAAAGVLTESRESGTVLVTRPFAASATPSITGSPSQGATLTAVTTGWSPAPNIAYQWLRDGAPIAGATTASYSLVVADAGTSVSVRITASLTGYITESRTSSGVAVPAFFAAAPIPTITGTAQQGSVLTAVAGTWSPSAALTYQWLRNGSAIAGATGPTYTLAAADGAQSVSVRVTGTLAGYVTLSRTSPGVAVTGVFAAPVPTVSGTLRAGYALKASTGTWSPAATSYSYRWYRNGVAISGATASTYKLTTTDRGKKITVKVTGKKAGYATVTKTSAAKTVYYEFAKTVKPTITGTLKAGATLTAVRGTWSPKPSYSYQWYRNGVKITGATAKTYKVKKLDKGKKITVKVTGKKTGYYTISRTSAAKTIAR